MRFLKKEDLISAVFCLLVGAFVLYDSKDFPKPIGDVYGGGPAFYPRLLAMVLIFLGIFLFLKLIFRSQKSFLHASEYVQVGRRKLTLVFLIFVSSIFLTYLIKYLGFYLASSFFIIGSMIMIKPILKKKDLLIYLIITVGILFSIYIIFELLFYVQLPRLSFPLS